jgi:hypothetical protein
MRSRRSRAPASVLRNFCSKGTLSRFGRDWTNRSVWKGVEVSNVFPV